MADYSAYKETSNRHLRFKLQSLSRRLDELEEATKNLQKAEDELLELQDKVIQAEGSNSSMLADVETLRKRVLKIEGKDEEIRKAEELCQLMKEKLEEEESLTRELKSEIERLQKRMTELEKLEDAFGRSKNDCTQLCLSLNEEKNLTKKISTELEVLKAKVKELEQSEDRLDKTEQSLMSELEKLKSLAVVFVNERKHFTEKEKQNEKIIQELTQKLEQNNKLNRADQTRNTSNLLERSSNSILERNDLRIEVDLTTSALSSKETRRKGSLDYLKLMENETRNKSENQKNKNQEDNKVKDLNQEIEKLKTQIKCFESLEEELKTLRAKNNDLHDSYLSEQNKNKVLTGQLEEIKTQMKKQKELENGEAEIEEINLPSRIKHDRAKHRTVAAESAVSKQKSRELSPQHRRERIRNRDSFNSESYGQGSKRVTSPNLNSRRTAKASSTSALLDTLATDGKQIENKPTSSQRESGTPPAEVKKSREQPSVLSRYPPAAQEHKSWKSSSKPKNESALRGKAEKISQMFNDTHHCKSDELEDTLSKTENAVSSPEKGNKTHLTESSILLTETRISSTNCGPTNGAALSYRHYLSAEMLDTEPTSSKMENTPSVSFRRQHLEEDSVKVSKPQERESIDAPVEVTKPLPLAKSWLSSKSQEDLLQSHSVPQKEKTDQASTLNSNNSGLKSSFTRTKVSTAEEKGKDTVALNTFDLGPKKEPVSRDFTSSVGSFRTSPLEHNKRSCGEEELRRSSKTSAAGLKSRRQFSPREALRSQAVIKPAIVEKDMKEIMGGSGSGPEANSEKQPAVFKTVSHKMTSSITIYPSEPVTQRTSTTEPRKDQQQVSASNSRVIPNELSTVGKAANTPYEISINKSNMSLKSPGTDQNGDPVLRSRVGTVVSKSSITIKPSELLEKNSESAVDTLHWKSHGPPNSSEAKHVTVRSAWRTRQGLHSLEDSATKADENATPRDPYRSSTDLSKSEGTGPRLYAIEQNSRRASAGINSWNTPELDSRRTKSSLSASEMHSQKSSANEPVDDSPWSCPVLPEEHKDFVLSSRRKPFSSSEQLSWANTPRKRPESKLESSCQLPGSKAEGRRRWSKGYSEGN
ncbi:leucine zipper protein 1 [Anolis carolinensis]|uniref:Leucine zipper protein 1 n=1 Tax=Anolis carolinensis TaxID=28377 RepID=H9GNT5_ANOCA|nr:PREDICTED: leucine zipper protein 1 [Anolis carolinensis]XP_008115293.1 PREDICTED: leucine zipper protein 1 [Anolis carolinensis]XP_008115294.1 PREDICTED: leucine zipper protein 1 [Anolis carolinensis]XP_016851532.1 PREDICTED: leucine zipper protein 1 [Anolis carolinensis]|eukprot:XP_003225005.2 PREDICTED: leucine zipper protein 1 [Anolis carolinensis]